MVVYMKVTSDKYELPLAIADSIVDLAEMCGIKPNSIYSKMSHFKNGTGTEKTCPYKKVVIDDDCR